MRMHKQVVYRRWDSVVKHMHINIIYNITWAETSFFTLLSQMDLTCVQIPGFFYISLRFSAMRSRSLIGTGALCCTRDALANDLASDAAGARCILFISINARLICGNACTCSIMSRDQRFNSLYLLLCKSAISASERDWLASALESLLIDVVL